MVEIEHFEVSAEKHPEDAAPDRAVWKVVIHVKFKSDDPAHWGEFRAYGASWTRLLNRTHVQRNIMDDDDVEPAPDRGLKSNPRRKETTSQLETLTTLPFWAVSGPPLQRPGLQWRLGVDQHMEIFYAKVVPGVPRSDPKSQKTLSDDDNEPDDPATPLCNQAYLAGLGTRWDIVAVDMPEYSPMQVGDFIEYWHRGEFRIRDPKSGMIFPQRKQLFCRVSGLYPNFVYHPSIDSVVDAGPASFEGYVWTSEATTYPHRNLVIPHQ
jgi:hypothetical protein